jgi:Protein of unknown function (DUF3768)
MSAGVADLPMCVRAQAVLKVHKFADFNENNDPYGEHDFGSFELAGETFFWKIEQGHDWRLRRPERPRRDRSCADHHVCGRVLIPVRPEQGLKRKPG